MIIYMDNSAAPSQQLQVEKRPGCVKAALEILGDKWTPLLLGQLVDTGHTFCELESALDGISPRTLSARLERLAMHGIVAKHMYCEHPPRFRYELTKKGSELQDILHAMAEWGDKYHSA